MSEIKNEIIEEKLIAATEDDPVMQEFLLTVVGNEYITTHYNRVYKEAIEKAVEAE